MTNSIFKLRSLSALSIAIKDGTHGTFKRVKDGMPFLSAKNITERGHVEWDDKDDRISKEDYISITSSFKPRTNDLLLTVVGSLGRRAIFEDAEIAFQRSVAFIRPNITVMNPRFLFHVIGDFSFYRQLVQRSNATAQAGLYLGELAKTAVPTPEPNEQIRIAFILDTIDEAIAKNERVISKLKQVRAGMLNDLLSYGLDEHGQLRDPIAHPEKFKDSQLGRIPKKWETIALGSLCNYIGSGVTPRGGQDVYTKEGVLFIRSQNVIFEGLKLDDIAYIPMHIHLGMSRSEVFAYDVLFNITGASIGRCCAMPDDMGQANVNQHVCILRIPDATAADSLFLSTVLESTIGQKQLDALNTCGNRQGLNYQQLGSFMVPWPQQGERHLIAQHVKKSATYLSKEIDEVKKLCAVKSGLQDDLLTGRVRVLETIMSAAESL